jgi:lysophospholipase L1-like esterase
MLPSVPPLDPSRFEDAIAAFEAKDTIQPPPRNSIVFVGSSSFTNWTQLEADFAPLPAINRGFGGSYLSESVYYADRIITPYSPRAVVVYAGENDIGNRMSGQHVFEQFQLLVAKVQASCPEAEFFFVSIKPSPGRGEGITQIRIANALIQAWAKATPQVTFIDIGTPMLGENGIGRAEFFLEDGIHMKRNGYLLWKEIILPYLQPLFS